MMLSPTNRAIVKRAKFQSDIGQLNVAERGNSTCTVKRLRSGMRCHGSYSTTHAIHALPTWRRKGSVELHGVAYKEFFAASTTAEIMQ